MGFLIQVVPELPPAGQSGGRGGEVQRLVALTQGLLLGWGWEAVGVGGSWWRVGLMLAGEPGALGGAGRAMFQ